MHRTGLYPIPLNPGKAEQLRAVLSVYRQTAVQIGRRQWRMLLTQGCFNKNEKLGVPTALSARYVQTCQYQVVGGLKSYLSNCANRFTELVVTSSIPEKTRIALLLLSKYQNWYKKEPTMLGEAIDAQTLRLARNIMRHVLSRHRRPDFSRCNMALDEKVAIVEKAKASYGFNRWIRLSTLVKGKPLLLPMADNPWFDAIPGEQMPFVQVNLRQDGSFMAGLVKDVAPTPYKPKTKVLGLDAGLRNLLSSSEGDVLGQNVIDKLIRWDGAVSTLAANRQKAGLKVSSPRYRRLVQRVRDYLKNEVHRTLKQVLLRHRPELVSIEYLDFRSPKMSRRMNRLVQNFGRSEFKKALASYAEVYGFAVSDTNPAYSSQECNHCHYVDAKNRVESKFVCRHCGHTTHADVNAARNHAHRAGVQSKVSGRSSALRVGGRKSRVQILQGLVEGFATKKRLASLQRQVLRDPGLLDPKRRYSSPGFHLLHNPYFKQVVKPVFGSVVPVVEA